MAEQIQPDEDTQNEVEQAICDIMETESVQFKRSCPGGMVNQNGVYQTDKGDVFVKLSDRPQARQMFHGEFASLEELRKADIVKVPCPIKVVALPTKGCALLMEYLELTALQDQKSFSKLGLSIAQLHLANEKRGRKGEATEGSIHHQTAGVGLYVDKFGFDIVTSNGFILQDTTWTDNWLDYWARKMQTQISLLESNYGEREVIELWNHLLPKLTKFFKEVEVKPSLLHADLWDENLGEVNGEVVMFDPGCFYGHSEFDLALPSLCDNPYWKDFFSSYHEIIPKAKGFENRAKLYQLYHHINHWNHFPPGSWDGDEQREDKFLAVTTLQKLLTVGF
ncbi:fructosamine-3-kinase-like [Liolophura sinensis]|uniref:fructosamine-3-kinase-like n=1 Tax=Liolophura sinensis TaxID=3198878 RepID=UPI0031581672